MDKQIQLKLMLSSKETEKLIKDGLEAVSQITGLSRSRIAEEYILIGLSHVLKDTSEGKEINKLLDKKESFTPINHRKIDKDAQR